MQTGKKITRTQANLAINSAVNGGYIDANEAMVLILSIRF